MIQKIKNWKKIVEKLKTVPAFGIHGTKYENLERIMRDIEGGRGVFGHYLGVGNEDKELSDDEFYERLYASVHLTQRYSQSYAGAGSQMKATSNLLLILGICYGEINHDVDLETESLNIFGRTFRIGHDMSSIFTFHPIILKKTSLKRIIGKSIDKYKLEQGFYRDLSIEYCVVEQVNNSLLREINRKLSQIR